MERDIIRMVNESAKDTLPNEFVATMRAEEGVITELLLLPGTIQSRRSGTLMLHMLPIDFSVVGTVHSHPGHSNHPSEADLALFSRFGSTHIITCMPFDMNSWRAYDRNGNPVELELV